MTEEQTNSQTDDQPEPQDPSSGEAWQEVGRQFISLGESLVAAFNTTWGSEETQRHLEKMKSELNTAAQQISQNVKDVSESEEAQKVQGEFKKAAQSAQATGQEAFDKVQPELVSALRTMRSEFDNLIQQMEQSSAKRESPETPGANQPKTDAETP